MFRKHAAVLFVLLLVIVGLAVPPGITVSTAQADNVDVYGRTLPKDAAPYSQQIYTVLCDSSNKQTTFSAAVAVYTRICGSDLFGDSLVVLDENLNLIPAAADKWEPSADGLTWTFHIHPGLVWSDGTPLTANDWVATYRYMADPKLAYDLVWLWQGVIKNWDYGVAGEMPPDHIGIKAVDHLMLAVTNHNPFPAFASVQFDWAPL